MALLSIITITKDDTPGLQATMASTSAWREAAGVEQIVIDGSSDPDALARDRALAAGASFVVQEPAGIARAFNLGIEQAGGQWLWFLNGGDQALASVPPAMALDHLAATAADIVCYRYRTEQGSIPLPSLSRLWPPVYNWIPHPSSIVRKALIDRVGPFDPSFRVAMDADFWWRAIVGGAAFDLMHLDLVSFAPGGASSDPRAVGREGLRLIRKNARTVVNSWLGGPRYFVDAIRHFWRMARS